MEFKTAFYSNSFFSNKLFLQIALSQKKRFLLQPARLKCERWHRGGNNCLDGRGHAGKQLGDYQVGKMYHTYRLGRPHICHLSSTESFKFLYRKSKFLVDYQVGKMYHTYHHGSRKEKNTNCPDLLGKIEGQFQFNWMTLTAPMLANGLVIYADPYILISQQSVQLESLFQQQR